VYEIIYVNEQLRDYFFKIEIIIHSNQHIYSTKIKTTELLFVILYQTFGTQNEKYRFASYATARQYSKKKRLKPLKDFASASGKIYKL